jgi:hypothetical protein
LDDRGITLPLPVAARDLSLRYKSTPVLRPTQLPIQSVLGAVKWSGREADHSAPFSGEVKNGGAIPPLPIRLHCVALNQLDRGITLTFILRP